MRYLFIEPQPPGGHVFTRIPLPRLGNVLLATILRDRGHECRVLLESIRPVTDPDLAWADVVAISSTTSTAPRAYDLGDRARQTGKPVVVGGPHVTFLPNEALEHADFVVRGEGDLTLPELAEVLDGLRRPDSVAGISFRREGEAVHTPDRPFVEDLDALPSPDFSLVEGWSSRRVLPVSTSRGCPFGCRFCSVIPMFGTRYRFLSVDRVLDDLTRCGRTTRHVFFCDDNFAAHRGRTRALCQGMLDRELGLNWSAQVRTDAARDEALVQLMSRAGCWCVYIGLESINPRTLAAYNKHQSVEDVRRAVATFRRAGIRVHGMFVLGADQDDPQVVRRTLATARRLGIETVQFLILTPAPGTPLFDEMAEANRLLTRDWSLYDGHHVVHQPVNFTPSELQAEATRASERFYSLRRAFGSLVRGRAFDFGLGLYAWRETHRFRRSARPFLRELREGLFRQAEAVRQILPQGPVKRVALPTGGLSEGHRRFLREFLGRLRLKIVEVPEAVAQLQGQWSAFLDRSPVVLLPLLEKDPHPVAELQPAGTLWGARVGDGAVLALPLTPDHIYRSCVEFGVALDRRLGTVRRAYRRALRAARLES